MKNIAEQDSLFNESLFSLADSTSDSSTNNGLEVVKMSYCGAETMSWQELFSGYDSLHAITFSSGVNFVYKLLDMFETAEIIFGCEHVLSYS